MGMCGQYVLNRSPVGRNSKPICISRSTGDRIFCEVVVDDNLASTRKSHDCLGNLHAHFACPINSNSIRHRGTGDPDHQSPSRLRPCCRIGLPQPHRWILHQSWQCSSSRQRALASELSTLVSGSSHFLHFKLHYKLMLPQITFQSCKNNQPMIEFSSFPFASSLHAAFKRHSFSGEFTANARGWFCAGTHLKGKPWERLKCQFRI